ncbi:putative GAF sensor protein [Thalassoporum mexicanum PCC 7367]|uniref:GAF domain-containing protein n=1 Tax=Thalassoporum mexicanum TaxID=3457544 RepID=UPI00029FCCA3|nr:GAF domain-containing protein [Pseudanabaena sp. PCC 7367]AFY68340.1 putative GAF sensor protein [Pseudanabaena sp. PCC 7367]
MSQPSDEFQNKVAPDAISLGLRDVMARLISVQFRDELVSEVTENLRTQLNTDRVALYYFYTRWKGQVTYEAIVNDRFSILGETGADDCFNQEYAQLYLEGRCKAISDIESEPIDDCHRDFLRSIDVRANLVVPVLVNDNLWGLLAAHHCRSPRLWTEADIEAMQTAAKLLANSEAIYPDD